MSRILISVALLLATVSTWGQTSQRYIVLDGPSSQARVFNVSDNAEVASIRTGALPNAAVISPNGRLAFVANANVEYVSVIDLTIQAEIARIRNSDPLQLAMTADGSKVLVTHINDEGITLIDARNLSVIRRVSLNGLAGDDPNAEDLNFNNPVILGDKAYLNTNFDIVVLDLSTFAVTPISGPDDSFFFQNAENLALTPDGKTLAAIRSGGLVLINTTTNSKILTIPFASLASVAAGPNPSNPAKMVAYVINSGTNGAEFSMVDLAPDSPTFGNVIGEVSLPPQVPVSSLTMISMNPDGTRAYVFSSTPRSTPNVFVIDTSAVIPHPEAAMVHQSTISLQPRGITIGATQIRPPATAPVVTDVNRSEVKNDSATSIKISGAQFQPGANVRIGTLDPIAAEVVSARELRVTIAANAPSQNASIIVTNPNTAQNVGLQQQSGILRNALTISGPENFKPDRQVGIVTLGDAGFSIIKDSNRDAIPTEIPVDGKRTIALAISPDGNRAYIGSVFPPASVDVFNFKTNSFEAHIIVNGDSVSSIGQARGIAFAPRLTNGKLAAYVLASKSGGLDLYAIDADPSSPTFNTVVDDIPTNIATAATKPGSLAMTPDGRFAFIDELDFVSAAGANFVVLNIATHAVTSIGADVLNINPFQLTMEVSPDGKFIILEGPLPQGDPFGIYDVSNPTAPALAATIHGNPPNTPVIILEFPRIVGNRLFAFDIDHNIVTIFNFNPAASDFSLIGQFNLPGAVGVLAAVADVSSDGKLIYMPLREEDSVAVMDVEKIIQHDPTALITKIGTGLTPVYAVIRAASADDAE
ncbi:MAG TPA: hypothetical protein VI636_16585 [Candidatus Angelobacter sp.]